MEELGRELDSDWALFPSITLFAIFEMDKYKAIYRARRLGLCKVNIH